MQTKFQVKTNPSVPDFMQLTYDNWSILFCQKIGSESNGSNFFSISDPSYHMLPAFQEGFFSDLVIKASNGAEVRKTLQLTTFKERFYQGFLQALAGNALVVWF
jgi:hypothetical protein